MNTFVDLGRRAHRKWIWAPLTLILIFATAYPVYADSNVKMVKVGPAAAIESPILKPPIVDGTVRDGLHSPKDGIPDYVLDGSVVQILDVDRPSQPFEDRGILEFDVSDLTQPKQKVELIVDVHGSMEPFPFAVDVFTYTGDGLLSLDDFLAGSFFTSFEYSGEPSIVLDVTPFVEAVTTAGNSYAGFNFQFSVPSEIPLNGPYVAFNSLEFPPAARLKFTDDEFTLTTDSVGNGTVAKNPDKALYSENELVILTAQPALGWFFTGWSGDVSETNMTTSVTMNSHKNVTATFSQGQTMAFVSARDGNDEIYLMNQDGSTQTRLTYNDATDNSPSWSPDGTKIAFSSDRDHDDGIGSEIYVMDANGGNQQRLTFEDNHPSGTAHGSWSPDWSPDGTKIAYMRYMDDNSELYVMDSDGGNQTRLTYNSEFDFGPNWSPDGSKIVFTSRRDGSAEIYVMSADGSDQTRITYNSGDNWDPDWSPDGNKIVFVSDRDFDYAIHDEIYIMDPDGNNPVRITTDATANYEPTWSPDGSKIAFTTYRHFDGEIYVMNVDGSGQVRLTENLVRDMMPTWMPTATIIVEKQTVPDNDPAVFDFTGDLAGAARDGEQLSIQVAPGQYTSTEATPAGWTLSAISCDDDDSVGNVGNRTATFNVVAGESVKCSFTNTKEHTLTAVKDGAGSGTVTSRPPGIDCGDDCSHVCKHGTSIKLTASATVGSKFTGWSGGHGTANPLDLDCDGPKTVTARFSEVLSYTLDVMTAGNGIVEKGPDQTLYDENTQVSIEAMADQGWIFYGWSGDVHDTSNPTTVTMDGNKKVVATFALRQHTLTAIKDGDGSGSVTSVPAGIDCGGVCSSAYDHGTTVKLAAGPSAGSDFAGWSGDCSSDSAVAMTTDKSCTATFALKQHGFTVYKQGAGDGTVTSTPAGIDCGNECSHAYDFGTSVVLSATAATGSNFTGWSGDCGDDGTVSITTDRSCAANFAIRQEKISVSKEGSGSGTVASMADGINCGEDCVHWYNHGTAVKLTANPAADSDFTGWSGECNADGTVSMTEKRSCVATFVLKQHTLYASKDGSGTGTITSTPDGIDCGDDCSHQYEHGTSVTLVAEPSAGSKFAAWRGDCDAAGTVTVDANRTCTASFSLKQRKLTVSKEGVGSGIVTSVPPGIICGVDCTYVFDHGTSVTLMPSAATGSEFTGWSGDCSDDGVVTMKKARSCTATFAVKQHSLTVSKAGTGSGVIASVPSGIDCGDSCTQQYDYGTSLLLTASPTTDSDFAGWSGGCDAMGKVLLDADRACTATFTRKQRTLTVLKDGTGSGNVTSTPAGINCGDGCSYGYPHGTSLAMVAEPALDSEFAGWSGDCDGVGNVTLDADRSCTATFALKQYQLTVSTDGTGFGNVTSTPAGIDCGADCSHVYDHGTAVTLMASAGSGSEFAQWGGDCGIDGTVIVNSACSCIAAFIEIETQAIYLPLVSSK